MGHLEYRQPGLKLEEFRRRCLVAGERNGLGLSRRWFRHRFLLRLRYRLVLRFLLLLDGLLLSLLGHLSSAASSDSP